MGGNDDGRSDQQGKYKFCPGEIPWSPSPPNSAYVGASPSCTAAGSVAEGVYGSTPSPQLWLAAGGRAVEQRIGEESIPAEPIC